MREPYGLCLGAKGDAGVRGYHNTMWSWQGLKNGFSEKILTRWRLWLTDQVWVAFDCWISNLQHLITSFLNIYQCFAQTLNALQPTGALTLQLTSVLEITVTHQLLVKEKKFKQLLEEEKINYADIFKILGNCSGVHVQRRSNYRQ